METACFRPVKDFRSPGRAPRCKPEVDDDVSDGSATLMDENEEWAKVSEWPVRYCLLCRGYLRNKIISKLFHNTIHMFCLSVNITSINSLLLIGVRLMLGVSFIPCHHYYSIVFCVTAYYGSFCFHSALYHARLLRVFNKTFSIQYIFQHVHCRWNNIRTPSPAEIILFQFQTWLRAKENSEIILNLFPCFVSRVTTVSGYVWNKIILK